MTTTGHNNSIDASHLQAFIDRIELLEKEKREISEGIKKYFSDTTASLYDSNVSKKIFSLVLLSAGALDEQKALHNVYKTVLGQMGGVVILGPIFPE